VSESRRTTLDRAAAATLFLTVVAASAGSSVEPGVVAFAKPGRWALLVVLGAVALVRALAFCSEWRLRPWVAATLSAYCALTIVSAAWSIHPRLTLERGLTVSLGVVVAATLAGSASLSPVTARRFVDALLAAVSAVAAAGFILWLVDASSAVQSASVEYPARFQGFEQNPNTGSMLLAVGMPLAFDRVITARTASARAGFAALLFVFVAEISASGSRGALAAGFLALLLVAVAWPGSRSRRAGLALAVVAVLAVASWTMTIPHALTATSAAPQALPTVSPSRPIDAEKVIPLAGEIGGPWWTHTSGTLHRTLVSSSTRLRAWRGGIAQGLGRPIAGYGFGTGESAFANRYYGFHSDLPENSYIGVFLQVGLVGLALFLASVAVCLVPGLRACFRGGGEPERRLPATIGGATAALLLGMSQSYFHAAGSIAFMALWVTLLLSSVAGMQRPA